MKLQFKQRLFSWLDSYDVYDEYGDTAYEVRGQLAWGHCLKVYNGNGNYCGMVKEVMFTFLPKFEIYVGNTYKGRIYKEFTLFKPQFNLECNGWQVQGNFMEWDYDIVDSAGRRVATISKELLRMTDTYNLDIVNPSDALAVLMVVLAIDAEKCSRN